MKATVYCPECRQIHKVPDERVGGTIRCIQCGKPFAARPGPAPPAAAAAEQARKEKKETAEKSRPEPAAPTTEAAREKGKSGSAPWYLYVPAVVPLLVPLMTLGGAVPGALGGGCAAGCVAVARKRSWSIVVRLLTQLGMIVLAFAGLFVFRCVINGFQETVFDFQMWYTEGLWQGRPLY
jgi:hypothetical protein